MGLAALSIYGVVASAAALRTREIGIRIALGAQRRDVTRSMLGQSGVFIALGVALGLAGSAAATPWLRGLLFGLGPLDVPTFVSVTIALAGVAALASYLPARRAARADPLSAIRLRVAGDAERRPGSWRRPTTTRRASGCRPACQPGSPAATMRGLVAPGAIILPRSRSGQPRTVEPWP